MQFVWKTYTTTFGMKHAHMLTNTHTQTHIKYTNVILNCVRGTCRQIYEETEGWYERHENVWRQIRFGMWMLGNFFFLKFILFFQWNRSRRRILFVLPRSKAKRTNHYHTCHWQNTETQKCVNKQCCVINKNIKKCLLMYDTQQFYSVCWFRYGCSACVTTRVQSTL